MKTHKDLDVWKKSINMVTIIYTLTRNFPKEELYGLTNQMRRAAYLYLQILLKGQVETQRKNCYSFYIMQQVLWRKCGNSINHCT